MGNKHSRYSQHSSSLPTPSRSLTPLYEACRDGNEEQVRNLLPKYTPAELNRQAYPYGGNTCLHVAAANGHDNIVQLLLRHGSYRSSLLNAQNQSAYEIAAASKESTRALFIRQDEHNPSLKSASRFYEQNATDCFEVVKVDENQDNEEKFPIKLERRPTVQTYKSEAEKKHEIEYSASSKAMCQSRFGRFCVNHFHSDEPLDHHNIVKRLTNLLEENSCDDSDDYIKADELIKEYQKNYYSIEQLLHLYTLETSFYRMLKQDCLPLALPLFVNLPKLKKRFFKGRVYRGMHMTYDQLLIYQIAMETPGSLLQTISFSSTSMDRIIAEQFAYFDMKSNEKDISVLFVFDFLDVCDQAINLSRLSADIPCLSEYEDEKEVLILPWTLFEVTRIRKATEEDELYTVYLNNVMIPKKTLVSTFKWTWIDLKNQLTKDKK